MPSKPMCLKNGGKLRGMIQRSYASVFSLILVGTMVVLALPVGPSITAALHRNVGYILFIRGLPKSWRFQPTTKPGQCGYAVADKSGAQDHFELALSNVGDDVRSLYGLGMLKWRLGECSHTLANWEAALELRSGDALLQSLAAQAYLAVGERDRPFDLLKKADGRGYLRDYLKEQGLDAQRRGEDDVAIAWYEFALTVEPDIQTANRLAQLYLRNGQISSATAMWNEVSQSSAVDTALHWWAIGESARLQREWGVAAEAYHRGLIYADAPYSFWEHLGMVLVADGQLERALEAYIEASKAGPDIMWGYLLAGSVVERLARYDEARSWYNVAAQVAPERQEPVKALEKLNRRHP